MPAVRSASSTTIPAVRPSPWPLCAVPCLGDEAFASLQDENPAEPKTEVSFTLQARDGNLQWGVTLTAGRVNGTWADADLAQIQANFIAAAKSAVRAHVSGDPAGLAEAGRLYAAADASADYAEGRRAFTEKRAPRFTGN